MYNILTLNKIAAVGLDRLGSNYNCAETQDAPDAVIVRSASMHDTEMPASLLAIARAGAGVNNIPVDKCAEQGIVVFNTPGANANAVKELVLAGLLLSSRKVVPAIEWAKTLKGKGDEVDKLVEKGKSQFAGPEIKGKKLGVIGLGAIGIMVANTAKSLGMEVYGYDPFMSLDAAWSLSRSINHAKSTKEIFDECDYITIHVPLNAETKNMVNSETIAQMKDGVRILNFSRAALVDSSAIKDALAAGKVSAYVVDFPTDDVLDVEGIIAIPHLGASTPESEDNCAVMAADEVKLFLETGSIKNSVNLPDVDAGSIYVDRICVIHRNIPNVLNQLSSAVSAAGINIDNMLSKSKKDYAYTVMDCAGDIGDSVVDVIGAVEGVLRVRVIRK
ncbi:MAG: phosphoglycerate dehydrogenase [Oscillospiraceae bacterium]|jgi:D-3-phosphoglycerate dehydrogenase|nr:phosphoglycerate dehydrogenase [Oscillospiraceae bacterium]